MSIVRAGRIIQLDRSLFYYQPAKDDSAVEAKLSSYLGNKVLCNRGCPELYKRMRREGLPWNHKKVERVYRKMGLSKRRKIKRRISNPEKRPLVQPDLMNMEVSYSFPAERVIAVLEQCIEWRGKPQRIRSDNGTEFTAIKTQKFFSNTEIAHILIQKGKPTQNGFIERFNRSYREGVLDAFILSSIDQA